MNTELLINKCKDYDRAAQSKLYQKYADKLMNISRRYANDIYEAQDVVQNAFVKIFTKINQFDDTKGNFENWIARITVNEALQLKRKQKRMMYVDDLTVVHEQLQEAKVFSNFSVSELTQIIDNLPESYKTVFNMIVIEGFSHKEVAQMLQINENTSRSHLLRARKSIQKTLVEKKIKVA